MLQSVREGALFKAAEADDEPRLRELLVFALGELVNFSPPVRSRTACVPPFSRLSPSWLWIVPPQGLSTRPFPFPWPRGRRRNPPPRGESLGRHSGESVLGERSGSLRYQQRMAQLQTHMQLGLSLSMACANPRPQVR